MRREEWLLLGLAAAGKTPLTPVRLQKLMFLLQRSTAASREVKTYEFVPYHYGPFDAAVYRDAEALESQGLVAIDRNAGFRRYSITDKGLGAAEAAKASAPAEAVDFIQKLVAWMTPLSFAALVRAVYEKYPEFKQNSVFQS